MKSIKDYKPRKKGDTAIAFFHYWEDGKINLQGYITELRNDYSGTCQLFSWLGGGETDEIHVTSAFFEDCTFYDSDYAMNIAYKRGNKK